MSLRTPRQWPPTHTSVGQTPTLIDPPSTGAAGTVERGSGPFVLSTPTHSPPPLSLGGGSPIAGTCVCVCGRARVCVLCVRGSVGVRVCVCVKPWV